MNTYLQQYPRHEPAPAGRAAGPVQQTQAYLPPPTPNTFGFDIIKSTNGHFVSKKEFFELQRLKSAASEPQRTQVMLPKPPEGTSNQIHQQDAPNWSNPVPQQGTAYAESRNPHILPNQRRPHHTNLSVTQQSNFDTSGPKPRSDPSTVHRSEYQTPPAYPSPNFPPSNIPDKQTTPRHLPGGPATNPNIRVEEKPPKEPKPSKKQKQAPADVYPDIGQDIRSTPPIVKTLSGQRAEDPNLGLHSGPDDSKPANNKKTKTKNAEQLQHPNTVNLYNNQNQTLKPNKQQSQAASISNPVQSTQKKNVLANTRNPMQADAGYEDSSFEHQPINLLHNDYNDSSRTGQSYQSGNTYHNPRAFINSCELSGTHNPSLTNKPQIYQYQEESLRPPVPGNTYPGMPKKDSKKNSAVPQPQKKPQPQKSTEVLPANEQQTREADIAPKKLPKKPKASPPEDAQTPGNQGHSSARPPAGENPYDSGRGLAPSQPALSDGKIDSSQLSKIRLLQDQVKLLEDSCVQLESFSRSIGIGIDFYLEYDWGKFVEKVRSYLSEVQKADTPATSGVNPQLKLSDKRLKILETSVSKKLAHIELILQSETKGEAAPAKEAAAKDKPAQQLAGESPGLLEPALQGATAPKPLEAAPTDRKASQPAIQGVDPTAATNEARPGQPLQSAAELDAYQDHYAFLSANSRETARVHQDFIKQNLTHSSYGSLIFSPFAYHYSPVSHYSVAANFAPQTASIQDANQIHGFDGYSSHLQDPTAEALGTGLPDPSLGLTPQADYYGDQSDYYPSEQGLEQLAGGFEAGDFGFAFQPGDSGEFSEAVPVAEGFQAEPVEPVVLEADADSGFPGPEFPAVFAGIGGREEVPAAGSVFRQPDTLLESEGFISNIALVGLASDLHAEDGFGFSSNLFGRLPSKKVAPVSTEAKDSRPSISNAFNLFAAGPARKDSNEQKKVSIERDDESSSGSLSRRELLFNSDDESYQEQDRRSSGEAADADVLATQENAHSGFSDSEALGPESLDMAHQTEANAEGVRSSAAGLHTQEFPHQQHQAEAAILHSNSEQSAEDRIPDTDHTDAPANNGLDTLNELELDIRASRDRIEFSHEHANTPRSEGKSIPDEVDSSKKQLIEQLDGAQASQRKLSDGRASPSEQASRQFVRQDSTSTHLFDIAGQTLESIGGPQNIDPQYRQLSAEASAVANNTDRSVQESHLDSTSPLPNFTKHDGSIHPDSNESHLPADHIQEQQISKISRPEDEAKPSQLLETDAKESDGNPEPQELPPLTMNQQSVTSHDTDIDKASRRAESEVLVDNKDSQAHHSTNETALVQSLQTSPNELLESSKDTQHVSQSERKDTSQNIKPCTDEVDTEANERDVRPTQGPAVASEPLADSAFAEKKSEAGSSSHSHQALAQDSSGQPSLKASEGPMSKQSHASVTGQKTPLASVPRIALQSQLRSNAESVSGKGLDYHRSKLEEVCQRALHESMASVRKVLETYASRRTDKKTPSDYFTREENPENLSLFDICTNPNYAVVVKKKINKLTESERIDFFYQIKPFLMELARDSIGILVVYTLISMSSRLSPDIKNIAIEMLIFFFLRNLWAFCRDPLTELIYRYVFDVSARSPVSPVLPLHQRPHHQRPHGRRLGALPAARSLRGIRPHILQVSVRRRGHRSLQQQTARVRRLLPRVSEDVRFSRGGLRQGQQAPARQNQPVAPACRT